MKKLLFLGVIGAAFYFGVFDQTLAFLGFGKARFGISSKDPLGVPEKIHAVLSSGGFEGELGQMNKSRKISYQLRADSSGKAPAGGGILIEVGDEEYVQSIKGAFVGTQHGMSPQRAGQIEIMMVDLWRAVGGPAKPQFESIKEGEMKIPGTVKYPGGASIPIKHMEASFSKDDVAGKWLYADSTPMEIIELALK